MEPPLERVFLDYSASRLDRLCLRIRDCLDRLSFEQIWARGSENENSIGNLVLHLSGNVRQWILAGCGGAPDVRQRDREFAARGSASPEELAGALHQTVTEAAAVIRDLTPARLAEVVAIQGYTLTVFEAVYHVVEHFSHHAGQIFYATKLVKHEDLGFFRPPGRTAWP